MKIILMEFVTTKNNNLKSSPLDRESLLSQTQKLLRRSGLRARKGLAQHFLIDREALDIIMSSAKLAPDDVVLEVGPGLGTLTKELGRMAGRVIAIELDGKLAALLKKELVSLNNVSIINKDVLKLMPEDLLSEAGFEGASENYKVVANLPYYITSPVLRHFLEAENKPESMMVMVQKEVAEEITAKPGKMSLLSVGVQFYGEPELVSYVPSTSFYPAPEVDSAIVRIIPHSGQAVDKGEEEGFFKVVRAGFSAARKQLANSLSIGLGIPKEEASVLLKEADISQQRRAETLSIEEWASLWRVYNGEKE